MNEDMKEFVTLLAKCGITEKPILAITTIITEKSAMKEMCRRLALAYDNGAKITDSLALQTLVDMMTEANNKVNEEEKGKC